VGGHGRCGPGFDLGGDPKGDGEGDEPEVVGVVVAGGAASGPIDRGVDAGAGAGRLGELVEGGGGGVMYAGEHFRGEEDDAVALVGESVVIAARVAGNVAGAKGVVEGVVGGRAARAQCV
jgi:hypothetical protein